MNDFKLIMLSAGFEHGGNTLHRFLDGHPSLKVYPMESMVGTPTAANLLTGSVPFRYAWPSFDSEMTPEQAYHAFYDEELKTYLRTIGRSKFKSCGIAMDERKRIEIFKALCKPERNSRADYVSAYFRSTFMAWENYNTSGQETHYVGYNPMVHLDADKIFSDFPDAQIVYVSRNPYSAYADTIKRPFPYSLEKYCQVWNVGQLQALNYLRKYPGKFHVFTNESLFTSREAAMTMLLSSLGLPWSSNVLYPSFNGQELSSIYPWGTIKTATAETNVNTANELTRDQKERITKECGVMIDAWGYNSFRI